MIEFDGERLDGRPMTNDERRLLGECTLNGASGGVRLIKLHRRYGPPEETPGQMRARMNAADRAEYDALMAWRLPPWTVKEIVEERR